MRFPAVEDIPDIESSRVNIKKLDPLLYDGVDATRFALRHWNNFKVMPPSNEESDLIALLRVQLDLFAVTHKSIRILIRRAYRQPDKKLISDAASLVREQVEKLFIIALVLDNPARWIKQHLRSALKTDLVEFLVELDEHSDKPRYQEHLKQQFPEYLRNGQRPLVPGHKRVTIASDFAIRAMRYHLEIGGPDPKWFKDAMKKLKSKKRRKQGLARYVSNYFDFPTPGQVLRLIKNQKLTLFLRRWHKEYSFICQYTHVALGKEMLAVLSEFKNRQSGQKLEKYSQALAGRVLFTSHNATASACAMVVAELVNTYGAKTKVREHWTQLHTRALPAKAFWNLYIKDLLR
jgi:hypothetical protein